MRAGLVHLALLAGAIVLAALIAFPLGFGLSAFGVLALYGIASVGLTVWLTGQDPDDEDESEAAALAAFAEEPLGTLIADAKDRLASARREVGRDATMYQPLNRLVRVTRKIERRLALRSELRPHFNRVLTQRLPLIATTAEQYVRLCGESLSDEQAERLIVAEGVLRESGDRLEQLAQADSKPDDAIVGLIRMDANAEVLAERLSADMDAVTARAAALRAAHALHKSAKSAEDRLASQMRGAAARIERLAGEDSPALRRFVETDLSSLVAASEAVAGSKDTASEEALRGHLRRLVQIEGEMQSPDKAEP